MWARSILGLERAKEERLRLFGQELPGFGIEQVQAVVVDDRGLLAEPFLPTDLAYGVVDAVAQLAGEGWAGQLIAGLAAAGAGNRRHAYVLVTTVVGCWFGPGAVTEKRTPNTKNPFKNLPCPASPPRTAPGLCADCRHSRQIS